MTEQICRVRVADTTIFETIRDVFSPSASEILKGALEAQQFTLRGSCEPSKPILSTNTDIAFSSESLQYGLQKPNDGNRGHVAGQKIPQIMYANGGRFLI